MRVINTPQAPSHTGPVPQAVESDGWIYVSALFGTDPSTGELPGDSRLEAERLFTNLTAILQAADASLTDIVRVGIYMKNLQRDRPIFNDVWKSYFREHRPARSAVEVSDFGRPREAVHFMVEAVAHRNSG
jgi:2-iminobutanoate/2-iminopropanoate deaminase